jgi:hypothetical protein
VAVFRRRARQPAAGHVPAGWGPVGTVVIETVDHHESLAELDNAMALAFTRLLARTQDAVRQVTGAERTADALRALLAASTMP